MINLETYPRLDFSREGLVNGLLYLFSDEDTNGNNGEEFLTDIARENGYKTTDDYHKAKWLAFEGTEAQLAEVAFMDYTDTITGYFEDYAYSIELDEQGRIVFIAFATYYND